MDDVRGARHNLRHHLMVIQSYIGSDDKERVKTYRNEHISSLPVVDDEIMFCENFAVNSILHHYVSVPKSEGVQTEVHLTMPPYLGISDNDLCIIFGNCIENAIEACKRLNDRKFIRINSKLTGKMLAITIDNSFDGKVKKDGDTLLSRKRKGDSVGIPSVKAAAQKLSDRFFVMLVFDCLLGKNL